VQAPCCAYQGEEELASLVRGSASSTYSPIPRPLVVEAYPDLRWKCPNRSLLCSQGEEVWKAQSCKATSVRKCKATTFDGAIDLGKVGAQGARSGWGRPPPPRRRVCSHSTTGGCRMPQGDHATPNRSLQVVLLSEGCRPLVVIPTGKAPSGRGMPPIHNQTSG
jgi:hypothetical protein